MKQVQAQHVHAGTLITSGGGIWTRVLVVERRTRHADIQGDVACLVFTDGTEAYMFCDAILWTRQ